MPDRVMVIVPRSAPALYNYLREKFAGDPSVSVVVDRRMRERRQKVGAATAERRGARGGGGGGGPGRAAARRAAAGLAAPGHRGRREVAGRPLHAPAHQSTRPRDEPVPPSARPQSSGLVSVGPGGAGAGAAGGQV